MKVNIENIHKRKLAESNFLSKSNLIQFLGTSVVN